MGINPGGRGDISLGESARESADGCVIVSGASPSGSMELNSSLSLNPRARSLRLSGWVPSWDCSGVTARADELLWAVAVLACRGRDTLFCVQSGTFASIFRVGVVRHTLCLFGKDTLCCVPSTLFFFAAMAGTSGATMKGEGLGTY